MFFKKVLIACLFLTLFSGTIFMQGCSSHRDTTVTTETVTESDPRYVPPSESTHVETRTTETVEHEDEHHGFFHILGDIIALPFRAIGALFHAIF